MQTNTFLVLLLAAVISLNTASAKTPAVPDRQFQWLGPMPEHRNLRQLTWALADSTMKKVQNNIAKSRQDLLLFSCKTPDQVGLVPDMEAVDLYIDGLPESNDDSAILKRLFAAAQKGNWLARLQTFAHLSGNASTEEGHYRAAKSLEWLVANDVGGAYSFIGFAVESSGYFSDSPQIAVTAFDVYAALHNGYPAQHKVGRSLLDSGNSRLQTVGKKMIACAEQSTPSYRRSLTGEAEQLKAARKQMQLEQSYAEIHRAIRSKQIAQLREILQRSPEQIHAKTADGYEPIEFALRQPIVDPEMIEALIKGGAQVRNHEVTLNNGRPREHMGLLSLAIATPHPDIKVVRLLVEAGADPINPARDSYSFSTPFHDAFDAYEIGEEDLLEFYLSTKKLMPESTLAKEYLVQAVGKRNVFERLLAYGISPVGAKDFWIELGRVYGEVTNGREELSGLISRYPDLRQEVRGEVGTRALASAVRDCHFTFASDLLKLGVRPDVDAPQSEGLLRSLVERCGRTDVNMEASARNKFVSSRELFVRLAVKGGLDLNAAQERCPAWTGFMCEPPEDDDLVDLLLQLGADPYHFDSGQQHSVLRSLVSSCRVGVLRTALAKAPSKLDANIVKGLSLALLATEQPIWEGLNCPEDFASTTAKLLISYGAKEERDADN
jgi:hypothetical protein